MSTIQFIIFSVFLIVLTLSTHTEVVPKKILERMNVAGLKREQVASHLQVYFPHFKNVVRLYIMFTKPFFGERFHVSCNM